MDSSALAAPDQLVVVVASYSARDDRELSNERLGGPFERFHQNNAQDTFLRQDGKPWSKSE